MKVIVKKLTHKSFLTFNEKLNFIINDLMPNTGYRPNVGYPSAGHGMEWNEKFSMEYGRCQNEMEWNGRQSSIPIPY